MKKIYTPPKKKPKPKQKSPSKKKKNQKTQITIKVISNQPLPQLGCKFVHGESKEIIFFPEAAYEQNNTI